jgi:hypothetical protein
MALEIAFAPLELAPKQFTVGDTIRVTFTFMYMVGEDTTITFQAVPYQYRLGILDRIGASAGTKELRLATATDPQEVQESVDFTLTGISAGTYGLLVEIPGTNYGAKIDGVLVVAGAPDVFSAMMPMLMMVMMLGMVMPMVTQSTAEEEETA